MKILIKYFFIKGRKCYYKCKFWFNNNNKNNSKNKGNNIVIEFELNWFKVSVFNIELILVGKG